MYYRLKPKAQQVLDLLQSGLTQTEITNRLNCTRANVSDYYRRLVDKGILKPANDRYSPDAALCLVPSTDNQQIIEDLRWLRTADCARLHNLSHWIITQIRKRHSVTSPQRSFAYRCKIHTVKSLKSRNLSLVEIARMLDLPYYSVQVMANRRLWAYGQ
jgi:DNA-binding CsgD family transcriptional regulator